MTDRNREAAERGLKALAQEPVEPRLYQQMVSELHNAKKKENPMKSYALKGAIATAAFAAIVAALVLIPATYSVTVGSLATVAFNADGPVKPMDVVKALSIPRSQKMMTVEAEYATITIAARKTDPDELKSAVEKSLASLPDKIPGLKVTVTPIKEDRGGNALAAVTGGRIEIGVEGLSDAEIEARIAQALSAHGLNVRSVEVSTTSPTPGQIERRVEIRAECDTLCDPVEIHLGDEPVDGARMERTIVRQEKWAVGDEAKRQAEEGK